MNLNHWLDGLRLKFSLPGQYRKRSRKLQERPAAQISSESLENRLLLTTTYINAGGPALGDFAVDNAFENGEGSPFARRGAIDTSLVDMNIPMAVFQTTLMDRGRDGTIGLNIPVTPGTEYQIDLLFSEIQNVASNPGTRVMDVVLDGNLVLDDYDIVADVGFRRGVAKSFNITASDNNLDISLTSLVGNAAISGVIISDMNDDGGGDPPPTNSAPTIGSIANQTVTENQTVGPLNFTVTDPDGDDVTVTATSSNPAVVSNGGVTVVGTGTNRTVAVTPVTDATGTTTVTLNASDGSLTDSKAFTVTVNAEDDPVDPPPTSGNATSLNAGGGAAGDFVSASPFVGASRTRAYGGGISGAPSGIPSAVFQTGLYTRGRDGNLSFDIPAAAGAEYQVDLLFAETFMRRAGRRVFDVSIDGQQVLNDLDIFATVGRDVALVETFTITGDGNLDIDLSHVRDNPFISGIIVTPLDGDGGQNPGTGGAPVLAPIGDVTVLRNGTVQLTASAADPDGDTLTYSINTVGLPGSPTINPQLGIFNWTPPSAGSFAVTVSASDGTLSDSEVFTVTVTDTPAGNQAPVLAPIATQQATIGVPLTFSVTATDANTGDSIAYALGPDAPAGANIDSSSGIVTWTPTASQAGTNSFTVSASDGALSDNETVTVNVTDSSSTNTAPSFGPVNDQIIQADQTLTVTPSVFDANAGDTHTFALVTTALPGNAAVNAATGEFTWTPPGSAVPGPFLVSMRVTDQGGLTDTVSFSVTVQEAGAPNNVPQLDPVGNRSIPVGDTLTFTATAFDADGPNDPLNFFLSSEAPAAATINSGTGVFSWSPLAGDAGGHTFSVGVTDGKDSALETITVTVTTGDNSAPIIDGIADQSVDAGSELQLTVTATDPDVGDTLTFALLTAGLPGTPQLDSSTGAFTWTPPFADGPGFHLEVQVTDSGGLTDTETFSVFVNDNPGSNTPPIIDPIAAQTGNVGSTLNFTVSATDSDVPPDTLSFFLDPTAPSGASIDSSTGAFTWTPQAEGTFTFPVLVGDGTANVSQDVTVTVGPATANQAPGFGPIGNQSVVVNNELQFTLSASDAENDALTFSLVTTNLPGGPQVDAASGVFTWTPTQISPGFNVTVRVEDGNGGSDDATFTVTVNDGSPGGNTLPSFAPIGNQTATVGQQLSVTVTATDPDPGTTLSYFLDPTAPTGAVINSTTGVLTWTPIANHVGTVTFPVFVSDGVVNVSANITVVVTTGGNNGPNGAPSFGPQNNRNVAAGATLTATITAIDDDPGDVLIYSLQSNLPGTATVNAQTGQFVWTPPASAAGQSIQVVIRATDPGGLSDDAVFTVNVTAAGSGNQAPVITAVPNQQATVGQLLSFTVNATDADGDTLDFFLDPTAPFGANLNSNTGVFTWTPATADIGTVTFPIFVGDGNTNRSVDVTIVVAASTGGGGGNTSPSMAPIDNQTVNEGATLTVTPVVDDPDANEVLTYELLTTNLPGSPTVNAQTGVFTWVPPNDAGTNTYSVSIRVTDSGGLTSTGTFNVLVNDV